MLYGGGIGMSNGMTTDFPHLADIVGLSVLEQAVLISEEVVKIQDDFCDHGNRRHARLKYTIEDRGVEWFKQVLNNRLGRRLNKPCEFLFESSTDPYGCIVDKDGRRAYGLLVQRGRLRDQGEINSRQAISQLTLEIVFELRLTANQNLVIARIPPVNQEKVDEILQEGMICLPYHLTGLRLNSIYFTDLPNCSIAIAKTLRFMPDLVDELVEMLCKFGLREESIIIRSTGFSYHNGCGLPYLGEIGLVGKVPEKYNLYLGGGLDGMPLNKLYLKAITHEEIVAESNPIQDNYAGNRSDGERFGGFCICSGYVKAIA